MAAKMASLNIWSNITLHTLMNILVNTIIDLIVTRTNLFFSYIIL